MRKRDGFFLAIAALAVSVVIWGNPITSLLTAFSSPPPPTFPIRSPSTRSPSTRSLAANPLAALDLGVDGAQLISHIEMLAQPRATPAQKEAARRYIITQLTAYGLTPLAQPYGDDTGGVNLIAELPGSDPTAGTVVLGAHYDTVENSPGADDNGSAIATLLEAARLFSTDSAIARPLPAALKLVFFDQEEQQPEGTGLLGSLAFTQQPDNIASVKGAVVLDMIGYACHTVGCQTYPLNLPLPDLPETGDFLAVLGLNSEPDMIDAFMLSAQSSSGPTIRTLPVPEPTLKLFPDLLRSDHVPFWDKGVPAVFVTDTANFRNPNYHTAQDTSATLDRSFLSGSAQHVINAIATLRNQPAP